jgi:hypothetical protein
MDSLADFVADRGDASRESGCVSSGILGWRDSQKVGGRFDIGATLLHDENPVATECAHEEAEFEDAIVPWGETFFLTTDNGVFGSQNQNGEIGTADSPEQVVHGAGGGTKNAVSPNLDQHAVVGQAGLDLLGNG